MKKAIQNYNAHKKSEENSVINFNLTFDEWYNWWLNNGLDRNISQGKRNKDTLCMCRYGDIGAYSLDNIYCATAGQNSKDMTTRHSIKRKIKTPQGIFNSLTDWSKVAGVSAGSFASRRKKNPKDYKYLDYRANKPDLN